jgi:hypothetical protein
LWVNLSPYEDNRIMPEKLSQTTMGQDLLSMDYLLKQLCDLPHYVNSVAFI